YVLSIILCVLSLFVSCTVFSFSFFFTPRPPTEIYTLSLHDALPISLTASSAVNGPKSLRSSTTFAAASNSAGRGEGRRAAQGLRSEEHTSELQSPYDLVCRLLLEKKKKKQKKSKSTENYTREASSST